MSSRYHVREGIVIRRTVLPNGDLIVSLLSETGKWQGLAKKGSRLGGNLSRLSLFHDVTVQYYHKQPDSLAILTQVQLNGALAKLSLPAVYPFAHVLAELADKLTVDVHIGENLYHYLTSALRGLCSHPQVSQLALVYAWKMIQQAGFSPRLSHCIHCGAKTTVTRFDPQTGGLTCADCEQGMPLPAEVVDDLKCILYQTVRQTLERPMANLETHWTLLKHYSAFHVAELRSLHNLKALEYA